MNVDHLCRDIQEGGSRKKINEFKKTLIDCAKNIKSNDETFKISTLPEVTGKLQGLMKQYINMIQSFEASQRTFLQMRDEDDDQPGSNTNTNIVDLSEFEERFKIAFAEQNAIVSNEARSQDDLNAVLRHTQARDEDIVVEEPVEMQIPKDPITKKDIKKAVRSKKCNHTYDKTSIEDYFTQKEKSKSRAPCPVAGCAVRAMLRSDIEPDDEMNRLIESMTNNS